ncbi:endolytic transglycosylase MltG [Nitratireductor sp. L1-7-SE]|uniref:Endolytic murein transglycosylase n=1 Tax=Nitratireductor rhodophyticola TaxID=2854036 RepID=A0ABS7RCQ5_9HYPH|nr:endolytic transglycosylase MltG [Nitratireductor rhodophyticola]MBY8918687.1 endolytic transglycosylase MltG [Nitratireductor rhodophyticola]MBY8920129.1 endolytic transglycosylase MltG [Nitratireductor rhodophyticola]MEC9243399.1 endolytic transglycosylase MltG [Pseudomonadota bacterium]
MTGTSGDNSGFGRQAGEERGRTFKSANQTLRPEAGTPPPRRSRRARSQFVVFLNFVFSSIVFLVILAGFAFYFGKREFHQPGPSRTAETVMIKPNTGVRQIASLLEREGVISDARIFSLGVRAYGADSELKAGEYAIDAGASMHEIMELLKSGKSVLYSLTIPEGQTVFQVFERIRETEELSGTLPEEMPAEGSLAADTLRFTRGMDRGAVVEKLLEDQQELVDSIWARRDEDLPVKDKNEFVTLASIVEKETGIADERPRVAAVFINRLRKGMRLQSDPTIIYGLFGGQGKPSDRPIYRSDLDKKTPYNTYLIDGLPPTPIANPGRAALEAVANPSQTDELYFVADGTGGHVFARTLKEHNENVARWRKIERERRAEEENAGENGSN